MKKIEKKFEKSSNTFQKTLDVAKKSSSPPPKHFQKRAEKKGKKKQKELKGGPKKVHKRVL